MRDVEGRAAPHFQAVQVVQLVRHEFAMASMS